MWMLRMLLVTLFFGACAFDAGVQTHPTGSILFPGAFPVVPITDQGSMYLSQSGGTEIVRGDAVYCAGPTGTVDNAWYRVFDPGGPFHVDWTLFAVESELADDATIIYYAYSGELGAASLDPSKLQQVATFAVPPATFAQPEGVGVAADLDLDGPFAIAIVSTDAVTTSGMATAYFHLGANADGQTAPAYWASHACGQDAPIAQSADLLIGAEGRYQ